MLFRSVFRHLPAGEIFSIEERNLFCLERKKEAGQDRSEGQSLHFLKEAVSESSRNTKRFHDDDAVPANFRPSD